MTDDFKKRPGPQKLFYKGRPVSLEELADMAHVHKSTMSRRLNKMNLTPEQAVAKKFAVSEQKKKGQIVIECKGITDTLSGWAKRVNIRLETLYERLYAEPTWTYDEALGGAPRRRPNSPLMTPETPDGPVTKTRKEWSQELGISLPTIAKRVSRGWNDSQALGFAQPPISFMMTNKYARTPEENEERRLRYAARKGGIPIPRKSKLPPMTLITPSGPFTKTRAEWCKQLGIPHSVVSYRLSAGWNDSQALGFAPPPSRSDAKNNAVSEQKSDRKNEDRRRRYAEKRKRQQKED